MRRQSDVESCCLGAKCYAVAAVECDLGKDGILENEVAAGAIIVIVCRAHICGKGCSGVSGVDIDLARNLLAIVALKGDALHLLTITSKLQFQPAADVLERELVILAL